MFHWRTPDSIDRLTRRRRGRDPRLIVGVLLIISSAGIGARILTSAGAQVPVWSASHDLAGGSVLKTGDLVAVPVHLGAVQGRYLPTAGSSPVGQRLLTAVSAGELVRQGALTAGADRRLVTLPVEPLHLPADLAHGASVDVYVTPRDSAGASEVSRLVLAAALVATVSTDQSSSGEVAVVLDVAPGQAAELISALRSGSVDFVGRTT